MSVRRLQSTSAGDVLSAAASPALTSYGGPFDSSPSVGGLDATGSAATAGGVLEALPAVSHRKAYLHDWWQRNKARLKARKLSLRTNCPACGLLPVAEQPDDCEACWALVGAQP